MEVVKFEPDQHYVDWTGPAPKGCCVQCFRKQKKVMRGKVLKVSKGAMTYGQTFYQCQCGNKWSEFPGDRKEFYGKADNE